MKDAKQIKSLLIIPGDKEKSAYGAEIDPNDLNPGDVAIEFDPLIREHMKKLVTVPVDTDSPEILERRRSFLRRHGYPMRDDRIEPQTESAKEYLEKFKRPGKGVTEQKSISLTDLKRIVADECAKRADAGKFDWIWDSRTKYMVLNMMLYFAGDRECAWDLNKGLYLHGNVGVGKTMLFEIFRDVSRKLFKPIGRNFKMATCRTVNDDYALSQDAGMIKYTKDNWCFDDLGNEELEHKHYGNSVIPIEQVVLARYGHFSAGRYFTHFSTNLSPDEVRDRYGLRMYDRIFHMMQSIELPGESRR